MTVDGHIKVEAHPLPFFSLSRTIGVGIDFNDSRTADSKAVLAELCDGLIESMSEELSSGTDMGEEPTTVDIAVSPAFEGGFTREDMNQVETDWNGRYDTVLALRFDGSVGEAVRENDETGDVRELDEWRRQWQ